MALRKRWSSLLMGGVAGLLAILPIGACSDPEVESNNSMQEAHARLALGFGSTEEFQRSVEQRARLTEELIRECMKNEGFDYIPADPSALVSGFRNLSSREAVEEWGFSISTVDYTSLEPETENPNAGIYLELSDEEQQAWNDQYTECDVTAGQQVYTEEGLADVDSAVELIFEQVRRDPAVVDALDSWSTCMSDAGFSYATEEALVEGLRADFSEVSAGGVDEFRERELETALISFDCGAELREARANARDDVIADLNPPWIEAVSES